MTTASLIVRDDSDRVLKVLTEMEHAVATLPSVERAMVVIDQADALRVLARRALKSGVVQNRCAYIKLLAQRRAGELLQHIPRAPIGGAQSGRGEKHSHTYGECLERLGLNAQTASRWQRLAELPEEVITKEWNRADERGEDLTEARMHAISKERRAKVRDAQAPARTAQVMKEQAIRRAYDRLLKSVGECLQVGTPDQRNLAAIVADRMYVTPSDVRELRRRLLELSRRVALACDLLSERVSAPMAMPLEYSLLSDEEAKHLRSTLAQARRLKAWR